MRVIGRISIIATKPKHYWYHRKGYYVGERWVKPKKIRKCKYVPTEPYLFGDLTLQDNRDLDLGRTYIDDSGRHWVCVNKTFYSDGAVSLLRIANPYLGTIYSDPQYLTPVSKPIGEKC